MATRNFVPQATNEGSIGTLEKKWAEVIAEKGTFGNLSNVDNTADMDKPVSTAQKTYIDAQDAATLTAANGQLGAHNISSAAHADIRDILKNAVGIPEWDNSNYVLKFEANDGATLEIDLPIESLAKDIGYDPLTKEVIITKQDNTEIRVSINDLVDIYVGFNGTHIQTTIESGNVIKAALKTGSITPAELSAALWSDISATIAHLDEKTNPHNVTKAQVGLGNVDDTSDANKPVSTPQKTYIDNQDTATLASAKSYTDTQLALAAFFELDENGDVMPVA